MLCKVSLDSLSASMPVIKVDDLNLLIISKRVHLGRWLNPAGPHLVHAEVQVPATMDSHEYDVILFIFLALRVFLLTVSDLILAGLSIEDTVEVIEHLHARCVQI